MSTYPDLNLYIDGQWRKTAGDMPVLNPATEEEIGRLPRAERADLDDALAAARKGFGIWRKTPPAERANVLLKAAMLMRERQGEIATAITMEHGKPLHQARMEVIRGCEFFEWDAGEATRTYGRVIPSAPGVRYIVHHQPIGTVAAFSPWNFPMSQPCRKVAGAIASGCSIILKAAEETPAGALHIANALHDAGCAEPGIRDAGRDIRLPDPEGPGATSGIYRFHRSRPASHDAGIPTHDAGADGTRRTCARHRL